MKTKPTVLYKDVQTPIVIGQSACVFPLNHPDSFRVSNKDWALTSIVVSVGPAKGEFETRNTIYKPC